MSTKHAAFFQALAAPFHPSEVKQLKKGKVIKYVTARTVMNRLDEVVGPENWWDDYTPGAESVICRLTITLPDGKVITKVDAGGYAGMSDQGDDDKSGFSDAFKRAAVKFGVSRYLYEDGVPIFPEEQPASDAPASQEPQPSARKPAEPWPSVAKAICDQANADWYTHMGVQEVQPRVKGEHKELMNVHQLTNHLCSHALAKESIKEDEVTTVKGDGEVVRDNTKVWAAVGRLHAKIPNKLRKEALAYIAGKREEAARSLDIPAYSNMTVMASN